MKTFFTCRSVFFKSRRNGFTLVELLIAVGLFGLIMAGVISVYLICQRMWLATTMKMQTTMTATMALNRMVYGIGTNHGLRAAAKVVMLTNFYGYRDPGATNYPLAPNATNHCLISSGAGNPPDGSWRMQASNELAGVRWIDYNRKASNIVFWAVTNSISSRLLIADYISNARAVTNNDELSISLAVSNRFGMTFATNYAETFIKLRNK